MVEGAFIYFIVFSDSAFCAVRCSWMYGGKC